MFGFKPSLNNFGNVDVKKFQVSNTLLALAAPNSNQSQYIIPNSVPIFNQGSLNTCVPNSCCAALEILNQLGTGSFSNLSRLFLYWNSRMESQETNQDSGTYIHYCLDSLKKLGVCDEQLWIYDASLLYAQPNILSYKQANSNLIADFFQIENDGSENMLGQIELSIRSNHCVVFGCAVDNSLLTYNGSNGVFNAPQQENIKGMHALTIIGVRINNGQREFLIRNSWGSGWGMSGCVWFSSEYMTDPNTSDIFVLTKMNNLMA